MFLGGQTGGVSKEVGSGTNYTVAAFTPGRMDGATTASTSKTKSTASESISGQTAKNTKATGRMESSTDKANLQITKANPGLDSGKTDSESSGYPTQSRKSNKYLLTNSFCKA